MNDNNDSLMVAFATQEEHTLPKGHFGQASQYEIYRLSGKSATYIESVANPRSGHSHEQKHGHQHQHAGGHSGGGAGQLLRPYGVQVMVSRAFGSNIKNMRQRFLPVKVETSKLDDAIALLQANWPRLQDHWLQGEARKHLVLRAAE